MTNKDDIKNLFMEEAHRIWGDIIDQVRFIFEERESKFLMSLAYYSRPSAYGNHILRCPREMKVYISPRLYTLTPESIRKTVIHEVIHIGYAGHSKEFIETCLKFGGTPSESYLTKQEFKVKIQPEGKKGERFKVVKTFSDMAEARRYAEELWLRYERRRKIKIEL